jgi:hypothetical protein
VKALGSNPSFPTLMVDELCLYKTTGYEVYASDSEKTGSSKGIFKDYGVAAAFAEHAGWYGSKGTVTSIVVYSDGEKLYTLSKPFQFRDVAENIEKRLRESILAKLTDEEKKFLKLD